MKQKDIVHLKTRDYPAHPLGLSDSIDSLCLSLSLSYFTALKIIEN